MMGDKDTKRTEKQKKYTLEIDVEKEVRKPKQRYSKCIEETLNWWID